MKRIISLLLTICICLYAVTGCAREEEIQIPGFQLFFINSEHTGLVAFDYTIQSVELDDAIEEVIGQLAQTPEKFQYVAPLDGKFSVESILLNEDQLTLDFSLEYFGLNSIEEVLVRAAIVKSLTGIDGIKSVLFTVNQEPITDGDGNIIGAMMSDQFVLNVGREINAYDETKITLYFANETGDGVRKTTREVVYSTNISKDRLVMEELIKGVGTVDEADSYVLNDDGDAIISVINPDTKVISTTVTDGVCYVNLSREFLTQTNQVTPEVTIYAIVNSLVELSGINKVQIVIEGDNSYVYQEVMPLSDIYERNLDIVK